MPVVVMIGPHAVGKTTALKRWARRYSRLRCYSLDDLRKEYPGSEEKARLLQECRQAPTVSVVESGPRSVSMISYLQDGDVLLLLTCPEPQGREWLTQRRGGRPPTDYWSPPRLDYECRGRMLNAVAKRGIAHTHFCIDNREEGWAAIDAHFSTVYRRLVYQLNRRVACP